MIYVDPRLGPKKTERGGKPRKPRNFTNHLGKLGWTFETLEYGDVMFYGIGPGGCGLKIGAELKKIEDFIGSIESGRLFGHQIPGLAKNYDIKYLILEGIYHRGPDGDLETLRGREWGPLRGSESHGRRWQWGDFTKALNAVSVGYGVHVLQCGNPRETACTIAALRNWWSKDWEEHSTSGVQYIQSLNDNGLYTYTKPSLVRRVAAMLPGVGNKRSTAVSKAFDTVLEMALASESEWRAIPGIGRKTAESVVRSIREERAAVDKTMMEEER
jgi:ERCC4-type nuclease